MNMQDAVRSVLGKYADFSGRARRSEYWYWTLAFLVTYIVVLIVGAALGRLGSFLLLALVLGTLVPGIAVAVRRLHDTGRSGLWYLIGFVPLVGGILLIVWFCGDSQPGDNAYGSSPKGGSPYGYGQAP